MICSDRGISIVLETHTAQLINFLSGSSRILALDMIHLSTGSQLRFLSDSLSCLQILQNRDLSHPLIAEILCRLFYVLCQGQLLREKNPSHCFACQVDLTAEQVLLHCVSFTNACSNHFCVILTSMYEFYSFL